MDVALMGGCRSMSTQWQHVLLQEGGCELSHYRPMCWAHMRADVRDARLEHQNTDELGGYINEKSKLSVS
jgi:hypothetical protein